MPPVEVIKVASVKYQIDRISTEEEDCWRDIDEERLEEIKTNIKDGNWGASVLQFARLVGEEDGKIIPSPHNGLPKVLDGNHIVRVLVELKKEWEASKNASAGGTGSAAVATGEAEETGEDPSWLKAGLKKQFEEGFEFGVFAFVGIAYDEVKHKVWCGHAHEEEQSNVLHTTIWHRHATSRLLFERHAQNWSLVQNELTKLLGNKSRRSVGRWMFCGRDLSPAVVSAWRGCPGAKKFAVNSLERNAWVTGKGSLGEQKKNFRRLG